MNKNIEIKLLTLTYFCILIFLDYNNGIKTQIKENIDFERLNRLFCPIFIYSRFHQYYMYIHLNLLLLDVDSHLYHVQRKTLKDRYIKLFYTFLGQILVCRDLKITPNKVKRRFSVLYKRFQRLFRSPFSDGWKNNITNILSFFLK